MTQAIPCYKLFPYKKKGGPCMEEFSLQSIREIALHAILDQLSVQEFFDRVYAVTGLPMICFDTSFQHIAHVFELPFYLQAWVEISLNSRANQEEIDRYNYLSFQETIVSAGKSIYVVPGRNAEHPSVNCAVIYQGELLAYCGTVVEDCDKELVLELNDLISQTIPHLLIPEMLTGKNLSPLIVKESLLPREAEEINRLFQNPYFFAVLSPNGCGASTMQYVRSYIEEHIEHIISAITESGDVYLLFSNTATDTVIKELHNILDRLGRKYSFLAAFSCSFFDAAEIPVRRHQALFTMNIGKHYHPEQHLYFLRFLYPEIISYCSARSVSSNMLLTPELKKLRDSAPEKAAEFFLDLFYYLFYDGNYRIAAQKRRIHKNTLIYRLSQICEYSGMNLSTDRDRMRHLLSLYLWLLNNRQLPEDIHE